MRRSVVLAAVLFLRVMAEAAVIRVPGEYPTIQAGINASSDGDTVLVEAGVYYENIRFNGRRIRVTTFEGGTPPPVGEAVIDGSCPVDPDSSAAVYFVDGEDETSVIEGFTITHDGMRRGGGRVAGEGIVCDEASPTITGNLVVGNSPHGIRYRDEGETRMLRVLHNEIRWNASTDAGGGLFIEESVGPGGSNALIEGNLFVGNTAYAGGAIAGRFTQDNKVIVRGNEFRSNVGVRGAGIRMEKCRSDLVVERNVMAGNEGAAVSLADYDPGTNLSLVNNTIDGNTDGVVLQFGNDAVIRNNIIVRNGSGITRGYFLSFSATYNDVWGNGGNDYVGCEPGEGDISEDPLFAGGVPFDHHLTGASPCIDAGDPADPPDPDGTRVDMGAFYYHQTAGVPAGQPAALSLAVWPNPSAAATHLALEIPAPAPRVTVVVYDAAGRLVRRLFDGPAAAGILRVNWDGRTEDRREAARGVYFVTARAGGSGGRAVAVRI